MKKNPFKALFKNTEQKTNDVLGAYPERVHVKAMPERRYLKTTRILTIFSIISLSVTMLFASIIYMIVPQKTASVILTTKDNQITGLKNVEPTEVYVNAMTLYFEKIVSDYVLMRHEVKADIDILTSKFEDKNSKLNMLSNVEQQSRMVSEFKATVQKIRNEGLTRKVNISWIKSLNLPSDNGGLFMVRFETLDFRHERPLNHIKKWEALVRVQRRSFIKKVDATSPEEDQKKYISMVENNPLGIKITNYVLSYVGSRPLVAKNK